MRGGVFAIASDASANGIPAPTAVDESNVSFTIPTTVPFYVKADGTVISPDADSWQLRNTGSVPITISSISLSDVKDGTLFTFSTSEAPVYGKSNSYGSWNCTIANGITELHTSTEDAFDSKEHPLTISDNLRIGWSTPSIGSDVLHSITSRPLKLADIAFTVSPVREQTFAVYSGDDGSLSFYRRVSTSLPAPGDTFNGKIATSVYSGFENGGYVYDMVSTTTNTPWFNHHDDIKSIRVVDSGIKLYNMAAFFAQLHNLTDGNEIVKFDTSECTNMHDLFFDCTSLKELNLSGLNTSKSLHLSCIFHNDSNLESIDLSGWNTSSCLSFERLFDNAGKLRNISGIASFDTSKVTVFRGMFYGCQMQYLPIDKWDVGNGSDFHLMFATSAIGNVNLSKWDMSNAKDISFMFAASAFSKLNDISGWNVSSVVDFECTVSNMSSLETLDISRWSIKSDASMNNFSNEDPLLRLVSLPASLPASSLRQGFLPSPSSASIPEATGKWYAVSDGSEYAVADIPTGKADTYYAVPAFAVYSASDKSLDFYNSHDIPKIGKSYRGKAVTDLYIGTEDTGYDVSPAWSNIVSKVESVEVVDVIRPRSLYRWFANSTSLKSLDMDKMDTSQVRTASYFLYSSAIDSLNLNGRDFSRCTDFNSMLSHLSNITELDVRNMDVSSGHEFYDMFYSDKKLTELDCTGWDTRSANSFWGFACNNPSLRVIDISSFTIDKTDVTDHMFGYDTECSLEELRIGKDCWLNKPVSSWNKDNIGALPKSKLPGSTGRWYSTADDSIYEYKANECTYPYGIATTLVPQMKAATPSNLTVSGKYVVGQTLTCNATAGYELKFHWEVGIDDLWKDIAGSYGNNSIKLADAQRLGRIRCVVEPASKRYDGEFFAYSDSGKGADETVFGLYYYGSKISVPETARSGVPLTVSMNGTLPDEASFGKSEPYITWMRDSGGTVIDKTGRDVTVSKKPSISYTKWSSFIGNVNVYPGNSYTLKYGSFIEEAGDEPSKIILVEWTKYPWSSIVSTLADVPYSATGGEVTFTIPENLNKNSYYTVIMSGGNWGENEIYQATMSDYKLICNGNGFVPIAKNVQSYDYVPGSDDIGHKIVACVWWDNSYCTISRRVSNQITVAK